MIVPHYHCADNYDWKADDANKHLLPSENASDDNGGCDGHYAFNPGSISLKTDAVKYFGVVLKNSRQIVNILELFLLVKALVLLKDT